MFSSIVEQWVSQWGSDMVTYGAVLGSPRPPHLHSSQFNMSRCCHWSTPNRKISECTHPDFSWERIWITRIARVSATGMSNKRFYIFWHFDLFQFLQLAIPSKTLIPSSWHEIWAQRCGENLFFNFEKKIQILPPPPTGILSRGCIGCAFPFYFQHLKKDINLVWPGTEKGYFWPHLRRPALAIDFYRVSWILYYWTPQKVSYHLIDPFLQDSLLMIVRSIPITFLTSLFLSFTQETLPWRPTSLFSLEQNPAWFRAPLLPCPTSLKSAVWSSFSLLQIKLSGSQHSVLFSLRMIF